MRKITEKVLATNKLMDTQLYKGGMELINDGIVLLIAASTAVTIFFVLLNLYKYRTAEEQEKPRHKKNIISTLVSGVLIILVEALVSVVFSYFTGV